MRDIRFFDMFSGIGGFRSGLEAVGGFKCVGHCEIDKHANKAYNAIYNPQGEYYCDDARTINPKTMPDFDLLCAGFPCQAFSVAGRRLGFLDMRGTLVFEVARIVEERRPPFILLENVLDLLSHDKSRTLETIFTVFAEMGYHLEWCVHNSKHFGVPQDRRRVYIVGFLEQRCAGQVFPLELGNAKNLEQIIHNHFCLNSVSFVDGKKFRGGSKAYWVMRAESDKICTEYGLSVIENPGKGKNYAEWKAEQEGRPTIRGQIKDELDEIIKASYTYKDFWRILKQRGYEVKCDVKYVALKPAYSQRYIRLKSLGENYSEESIQRRIAMARNGIRVLDKPTPDYNAWLNKYEPTKLHGFKALYFHYLYLFGKIRKKETPQRISFYMREELIKFDRYQKQFHFLVENNIETTAQLKIFKENAENKMSELTHKRSRLYSKADPTIEIKTINAELREVRKNIRICNNIFQDIETIREHQNYVIWLEQEAEKDKKRRYLGKER